MPPTAPHARARANVAVHAFILQDAGPTPVTARETLRFGMRLLTPAALLPLTDILDDGRAGHPVQVFCAADPGGGATTFLLMAAMEGRKRGYVPVSTGTLERCPDLWSVLSSRTCLMLCDAPERAEAAYRWLFRAAATSSRSHVLLRIGTRAASPRADVVLGLKPFSADVLAAHVHVYPARLSEGEVRRAAVRSGGLPRKFLDCLRGHHREVRPMLQVAEARPAYGLEEAPSSDLGLQHPWSDLIASALRSWAQGRRLGAERDLRQVASAARRRQMDTAAAAAEVELARLLAARGRTTAARELLASAREVCDNSASLSIACALALADVDLAEGALETAENVFRVCRTQEPERAGIGLTRTLCWQARYEEAAYAVAPALEAADARTRAEGLILLGISALGQHDLPRAAHAAAEALSLGEAHEAPGVTAFAAELLVSVHGRLGDWESVGRYAGRGLLAARTAGSSTAILHLRVAVLEARRRCRRDPDRRGLERLLRVAPGAPGLTRARIWVLAMCVHPVERSRVEFEARVRAFVQTSGARALLPEVAEPAGAALARDVEALLAIQERAPSAREGLQQLADWLRERVGARALVISGPDALALVRSGQMDAIAAARRVLTTRAAQPPWASTDGLEAAVLVRHADIVRGALACRWPLSRHVSAQTLPLMSAAASIVGPVLSELAERPATQGSPASDGMIGRSAAIQRLRDLVTRAAPAPFPVIVEGESGVGKELVARAIHQASPRRLRACVAINCAALTDDLLEAELFGHARGAFTGAHVERAGLFEQADGGSVFLDEVSELSPRAQAKLLRVLQDGEVRRIGESHARKVDVRVIAASNRSLNVEVEAGKFRSDLLFRLAVVRISVPPLRARAEDIPILAAHFWQTAASRAASRAVLSAEAIARLSRYEWPGNVRELQNVIAALAVQVPRGRILPGHVSALLDTPEEEGASLEADVATLDRARHDFERQFVSRTLARCGGRHTTAARQLGISRQGLAKLLHRLQLVE